MSYHMSCDTIFAGRQLVMTFQYLYLGAEATAAQELRDTQIHRGRLKTWVCGKKNPKKTHTWQSLHFLSSCISTYPAILSGRRRPSSGFLHNNDWYKYKFLWTMGAALSKASVTARTLQPGHSCVRWLMWTWWSQVSQNSVCPKLISSNGGGELLEVNVKFEMLPFLWNKVNSYNIFRM